MLASSLDHVNVNLNMNYFHRDPFLQVFTPKTNIKHENPTLSTPSSMFDPTSLAPTNAPTKLPTARNGAILQFTLPSFEFVYVPTIAGRTMAHNDVPNAEW